MKGPSTTRHGVLLLSLLLIASFQSSHGQGPALPTAGSPTTAASTTTPSPDSTSTPPLPTTSTPDATTTTTTPQMTVTTTPEPTTMPSTTTTTTTEATTTPMPSTTTTTTETTTTTTTTPMPSTTAAETMTSSTTITTTPISTTSTETTSETTTTSITTTTTQSAGEPSSTVQKSTTTAVASTTAPSETTTTTTTNIAPSTAMDTSASMMSSSVVPGPTTSADMSSSTATSATTTPKPKYPTKKLEKPFKVSVNIGDSSDDAVYCKSSSTCTYKTLSRNINTAFSSIPGFQYAKEKTSASQRRKRDTLVYVLVVFDSNVLSRLSKDSRLSNVTKALNTLNASSLLAVNMTAANTSIVQQFVEADMCSTPVVCGVGYSCKQDRCHHLCESYDCGDNGVCNTVVHADGTSSAQCVCLSDDDHTYSGDRCQDEETSKAKVASIVGGVLGTFCAIFLLVIIFLACRLRNGEGGSKRKYQLGGYSNNGYADQEFAMKNVSDNP